MKNNQNNQIMRGGKRVGAGRPKGSANKVTTDLREMLHDFAFQSLQQLPSLYSNLESDKERLEFIVRLLPYVAPRLQAVAVQQQQQYQPAEPVEVKIVFADAE